MDQEILSQIFDPFFTTREVGAGLGLGLSVVYGMIKSHNGSIHVSSKPGKGTTFTLFFSKLEIQD
jgi:two-component system cell cycle sensor histidine kinase/response regulator CckA